MTSVAALWLLLVLVPLAQSRSAFPGLLDSHPAIDYRGAPVNDAVTHVMRAVATGTTKLTYESRSGYLTAMLDALNIPVESQILLFSKTGVQNAHTTPEHPRALYFNDRAIVGYIPDAPLLEMASLDARQGVIFQTLAQSDAGVKFDRPNRCLSCHISENSLEVPGILVRSNFTAIDGRALPQLGSFVIDHRSPFAQRWGGWYVMGTHGPTRHMGNAFVTDMANAESAITEKTLNRTSIDPRVDASAYPAATSDIVALMVFDHQGRAMNLLTRLGWEARVAAAAGGIDVTRGEVADAIQATVDYLSFAGEAPLSTPIKGVSAFATTFAQSGTRTRDGRSLRDFDLQTRLFKYRCSYMIYSPAFDALPGEVKREVFVRLRRAITDRDTIALLDETIPEWRQ